MRIRATLIASALLALALPATAQESGGLRIAPEAKGGPVGLARPLPSPQALITAADLQGAMSPTDRQAQHQSMISRLRGDPGLLAGFSFGQPLAASRQPGAVVRRQRRRLWSAVRPSPSPQPADRHQQSGPARRHRRQRQSRAAAERQRPRTDRPAADRRNRPRRCTQPGHRRRQHHPALARHTLSAKRAQNVAQRRTLRAFIFMHLAGRRKQTDSRSELLNSAATLATAFCCSPTHPTGRHTQEDPTMRRRHSLFAATTTALMLAASVASAQPVQIFDEAPPLELLRSIMIPESNGGTSRSIVIQKPDTSTRPSPVQRAATTVARAGNTHHLTCHSGGCQVQRRTSDVDGF